jgi:hypothetical protein
VVKQGRKIGEKFYVFEVGEDAAGDLHIKASDVESPEILNQKFTYAQVDHLLGPDVNYENLVLNCALTEDGAITIPDAVASSEGLAEPAELVSVTDDKLLFKQGKEIEGGFFIMEVYL